MLNVVYLVLVMNTYGSAPTAKYYSPSTNIAKRKSNQIILLPPF